MKRIDLNRRDFSKLTMAAFGGLVAGSTVGCSEQDSSSTTPDSGGDATATGDAATPEAGDKTDTGDTTAVNYLLQEPHVCRGLNSCMNKGASKENACAGQGTCASVAKHDCGGMNECKGQGGCGENPGQNDCSQKGSCHVPLNPEKWPEARAAFEAAMKAAGNSVGDAPAG